MQGSRLPISPKMVAKVKIASKSLTFQVKVFAQQRIKNLCVLGGKN